MCETGGDDDHAAAVLEPVVLIVPVLPVGIWGRGRQCVGLLGPGPPLLGGSPRQQQQQPVSSREHEVTGSPDYGDNG